MTIDQLVSIRRGVNKTRDADDRYHHRFLALNRDVSSGELKKNSFDFSDRDETNIIKVFDMKKKIIHSDLCHLESMPDVKHLLHNNDIIVSALGKDIYLYQGPDDVVCVEQNFLIIRLHPDYQGVADKITFSLLCYIAKAIEHIMKSGYMRYRIDFSELRLTKIPEIEELMRINDVCKTSLELLNLLNAQNTLENELITKQLNNLM